MRNWFTVRIRSPSRRGRGNPVSAMARTIRSSPMARISSAIASSKSARTIGELVASTLAAAAAAASARSTSRADAVAKGGSRGSPLAAATALNIGCAASETLRSKTVMQYFSKTRRPPKASSDLAHLRATAGEGSQCVPLETQSRRVLTRL